MSDDHGTAAPVPASGGIPPLSAGTLLREARRSQGIHIAALAAAIKVSPQKLELLETDRFDQLPDATFARALAQTVCRQLKIDPEPVLARLPQGAQLRFDRLGGGLNAPFRDRPGRIEPNETPLLGRPAVWVPLLLVIAALGVLFLPFDFRFGDSADADLALGESGTVTLPVSQLPDAAPEGAGAASAAVVVPPFEPALVAGALPPAAAEPAASVAAGAAALTSEPPAAGTPSAAATPGAGPLTIDVRQSSWVRVVDGTGRTLLSREVKAGESLSFDGPLPMNLVVGNIAGTTVRLRGEVVDLSRGSKGDNVARLQVP